MTTMIPTDLVKAGDDFRRLPCIDILRNGVIYMAKKSVTDKELIVRNPGEPFFKAFVFDHEPAEMGVDISGDTFSPTIEDAIHALFLHTRTTDIVKMPDLQLFLDPTLEPIDLDDNRPTNDFLRKIVVVKIRANYDQEMEDATQEYEALNEYEFFVRLKALTEGYSMGAQDYSVRYLEMKTPKGEMTPKLVKVELAVDDVERMNTSFPQVLTVEG